jgi:hypothetical protein
VLTVLVVVLTSVGNVLSTVTSAAAVVTVLFAALCVTAVVSIPVLGLSHSPPSGHWRLYTAVK